MDKDMMFNIVLCVLLVVLSITYCVFVLFDEMSKIKYYESSLSYETDWDKYNRMVKRQKRIITIKKIKLKYYQFLVFIKRLFIWKKK